MTNPSIGILNAFTSSPEHILEHSPPLQYQHGTLQGRRLQETDRKYTGNRQEIDEK